MSGEEEREDRRREGGERGGGGGEEGRGGVGRWRRRERRTGEEVGALVAEK